MKVTLKNIQLEFLVVSLVSIVLLALYYFRTELITVAHPKFDLPWDRHKYIEMSLSGLDFHIAPFCRRILVPLLTSILPFDVQTNFILITITFLFATSIVVFYLIKEIFKNNIYAWLGLLIYFSLGWLIKGVLNDFWLVDSALYFFIVLSVLLIIKKQNFSLSFAALFGAATKEMFFYIVPFYFLYNKKQTSFKTAIKSTVLVFLPAVLIFVMIVLLFPAKNHILEYVESLPVTLSQITIYGSKFDFELFYISITKQFELKSFVLNIFGTYGIYVLTFSLIGWIFNTENRLMYLVMILFSVTPLLFTILNIQRLMIISFPFLIILTIRGIDFIFKKINMSIVYSILFPLPLIIANLYFYERIFTSLKIQLILFLMSTLILIGIYILRRLK